MNQNYRPAYGPSSPSRKRIDNQTTMNGSPPLIYRYGLTNPNTTTTTTTTTIQQQQQQNNSNRYQQYTSNNRLNGINNNNISSMSDNDENDVEFDSDHSNHQHNKYITTNYNQQQQQHATALRQNVLNENKDKQHQHQQNKQQQQYSNQQNTSIDRDFNKNTTTGTSTTGQTKSSSSLSFGNRIFNLSKKVQDNFLVTIATIVVMFAFIGLLDLSFYYIAGRFLFLSTYLNSTIISSSSSSSSLPATSISPLAIQEQLPIISNYIENTKWSQNIQTSLLDQSSLIQEINRNFNSFKEELSGHNQLIEHIRKDISTMKSTIEKISVNRDIDIDSLKTEIKQYMQQSMTELESRVSQHQEKIDHHQTQSIRALDTKYQSLVDELDKLTTKQLSTITNEYSVAQQQWETQLENVKQSLDAVSKELTQSLKLATDKQYEQQYQQANQKLNALFLSIQTKLERVQAFINENPSITSLSSSITSLEDLLEIYSADKIAKSDFALYSAGGSIEYNSIFRISPTYPALDNSIYTKATSWFIPHPKPNPPETILDPKVVTGSCWGFEGSNGTVVIKLAKRIRITDVTLEHINPSISYHIDSSPKEFKVIGLKNTTDHGIDLGTFTYDITKNRHLQTFEIFNNVEDEFSHVVLQVLSNYGYKYTCVYRFRVHGYPVPEEIVETTTTISTTENSNNNNNDSDQITPSPEQIVETTFQEQDQDQDIEN